MANEVQDADMYLKIRYNYIINIKKIESFSKELLKFNYNKELFNYIEKYINDLNNDMYSKNNIDKTYEIEKSLLNKNKFFNLEILFHAFNKLFSKRINKNSLNVTSISDKKECLLKKLNKLKKEKNFKKNKINYKVLVNSLTIIELIFFIEYAVNVIENNIN